MSSLLATFGGGFARGEVNWSSRGRIELEGPGRGLSEFSNEATKASISSVESGEGGGDIAGRYPVPVAFELRESRGTTTVYAPELSQGIQIDTLRAPCQMA